MLISAAEAAGRLKVKPATLYAYVSRGLIRSAPQGDGRAHGYYAEDVERLRQGRRSGRRRATPLKPFDAVTPVLDSALCLIEGGRLYYRGQDAVRLASMCKLKAGRIAREITDSCLQFWGGQGYMWETNVARAYRDVRLVSIGGGADEIMLGIICKMMGTLPSKKKFEAAKSAKTAA